jgi:hypothetical protein
MFAVVSEDVDGAVVVVRGMIKESCVHTSCKRKKIATMILFL